MTFATDNPVPATPLPPYAMTKAHQFKLVTNPRGQGVWVPRARFRDKKHRGACAGAFGGPKGAR